MKEILAAFTLAMTQLKEKANAALASVGPVDQFEGAREVAYALGTLNYGKEEVERLLARVGEIAAKYDGDVEAAAAALVDTKITEMVTAGELMRKPDVEAALSLAEKKGKDDAALEFAEEKKESETIAARRKSLGETIGEEAAALVKDDQLKGDDDAYNGFVTELGRRTTALAEIGVTAKDDKTKAAYEDMACCISFGEGGATSFDSRLAVVKSLVPAGGGARRETAAASQRPGGGVPPVTTPGKTGAGDANGGSTGKEKPKYAF